MQYERAHQEEKKKAPLQKHLRSRETTVFFSAQKKENRRDNEERIVCDGQQARQVTKPCHTSRQQKKQAKEKQQEKGVK